MAARPIESLEQLLRALGRERSLRGRLRVIGQSWDLLRGLSRKEREQVALRMGSDWAWRRLEKSFLADGELGESERLVGRVFERMGGSDPDELRDLARQVRERDTGGLTDSLMLTLREALEEEAEEAEEAQEAERAESEHAPAEGEPPAPDPEHEPDPRAAGEVVGSAAGVLASTLARDVSAPAEARAPARPTAEPPAPAPPARSQPKAPPDPPAQRAATPQHAPIPVSPSVPMPAPAAEPAPAPTVDGVAEALGDAAASGADRLRVLRALARDPGAGLGRRGRARLIEALGGGWASRRALSRMIAARALDDLDEALDLVERLERPGQRTWCLADLLRHWSLDADERARIVDLAPTDAARRRLGVRSAAAR